MEVGQSLVNVFIDICCRIGSERRNVFGSEIRASVAPGPGVYEQYKGLSFVKGKFSPTITMAAKFKNSAINNPEMSPGPGSYDN